MIITLGGAPGRRTQDEADLGAAAVGLGPPGLRFVFGEAPAVPSVVPVATPTGGTDHPAARGVGRRTLTATRPAW